MNTIDSAMSGGMEVVMVILKVNVIPYYIAALRCRRLNSLIIRSTKLSLKLSFYLGKKLSKKNLELLKDRKQERSYIYYSTTLC